MLKIGDVFKLENGMKVMTKVPEKFVTSNNRFSTLETNTVIVVGKTVELTENDIKLARNRIADNVIKAFDSDGAVINMDDAVTFTNEMLSTYALRIPDSFTLYGGDFVVIDTKFDGGSTGYDAYPNGHHVFAKRLNPDGTYNPDGTEIDFYQSGCFNHIIENVVVIKRMKVTKTLTVTVE